MEEQVALTPNRSIGGDIYARYSPGRDHYHTHRTPKLPTFQATVLHLLSSPEAKKPRSVD